MYLADADLFEAIYATTLIASSDLTSPCFYLVLKAHVESPCC